MEKQNNTLRSLLALHHRPAPFAPGTDDIWTDDHLSKGMLAAHLNPDNDAASYAQEKRAQAIAWIKAALPHDIYPRVLDLGCGPGLYTLALAESGYEATGIDFSARSIAYAKEKAAGTGLPVQYLHSDYLQANLAPQAFDLVMMISCDFGVLSPAQRATLLQKAFDALRPGGRLLMDVCTTDRATPPDGTQTWTSGDGGYWSPSAYMLLETFYQYPENDTCRQAILWDDRGVRAFHIWEHRFVVAELAKALQASGFAAPVCYGDLNRTPYRAGGPYLCVLAEKP